MTQVLSEHECCEAKEQRSSSSREEWATKRGSETRRRAESAAHSRRRARGPDVTVCSSIVTTEGYASTATDRNREIDLSRRYSPPKSSRLTLVSSCTPPPTLREAPPHPSGPIRRPRSPTARDERTAVHPTLASPPRLLPFLSHCRTEADSSAACRSPDTLAQAA